MIIHDQFMVIRNQEKKLCVSSHRFSDTILCVPVSLCSPPKSNSLRVHPKQISQKPSVSLCSTYFLRALCVPVFKT